jgi:DNA mismatch repair protein MutS2
MKKNHQVGEVMEIKGKKAIVKLGLIPITVDLSDLVVVTEKDVAPSSSSARAKL